MNGYAIKVHKPVADPDAVAHERREAFEQVLLARRASELAADWTDDAKQAAAARWEALAKELMDAARFVRELVPADWIPPFLRAESTLPLFARRQAGDL